MKKLNMKKRPSIPSFYYFSRCCFMAINEEFGVYYFTKLPWNILWRAAVVFVFKPWWNHCWLESQECSSDRVHDGLWVPVQPANHGFVIKVPWPWPFQDQGSKPHSSFDRPPTAVTRPGPGVIIGTQPVGSFESRPDFPVFFYSSTNVTPSFSLCDPGDLWPWGLLQYSAPAHHLPRWLQLETGTVMIHK